MWLSALSAIRGFGIDRGGSTMIEYALIGSIVAVMMLVAMTLFQDAMTNLFDYIAVTISNAVAS